MHVTWGMVFYFTRGDSDRNRVNDWVMLKKLMHKIFTISMYKYIYNIIYNTNQQRGCSSYGRALASHARGTLSIPRVSNFSLNYLLSNFRVFSPLEFQSCFCQEQISYIHMYSGQCFVTAVKVKLIQKLPQ